MLCVAMLCASVKESHVTMLFVNRLCTTMLSMTELYVTEFV